MMLLKKKIVRLGLNLCLSMVAALSPFSQAMAAKSIKSFVNDDDRFMALRDAAIHDDASAAQAYAGALGNYEIPSYVDYYCSGQKWCPPRLAR